MNTFNRDAQCTEKSVFYGFLSTTPPQTPLHSRHSRLCTDNQMTFGHESTDFVLLGSATTPSPRPIALYRLAAFRARRVNIYGYYPKSQDFSEFRLGSPVSTVIFKAQSKKVFVRRDRPTRSNPDEVPDFSATKRISKRSSQSEYKHMCKNNSRSIMESDEELINQLT